MKTISAPKPKSCTSSAAAVRYRIAKPNLVACSASPGGRGGYKETSDMTVKSAIGAGTRDLSSTLKVSPMMSVKSAAKTEPKPKPASIVKRPSSAVTVGGAVPLLSSSSRQTPRTATERRRTPTDFVRGLGARATLPAAVLTENKRAAAVESRLGGGRDTVAPSPQPSLKKTTTTTTTSVEKNRATARIGQISNDPTLPPTTTRKLPSLPPAAATNLPAVETARLSPLNSSTSVVVREQKKQTNAESSTRSAKGDTAKALTPSNAGHNKTPKVSSLGRRVVNSKPNSRSMSPSTTTKVSHVTTQRKDNSNVTTDVPSTS